MDRQEVPNPEDLEVQDVLSSEAEIAEVMNFNPFPVGEEGDEPSGDSGGQEAEPEASPSAEVPPSDAAQPVVSQPIQAPSSPQPQEQPRESGPSVNDLLQIIRTQNENMEQMRQMLNQNWQGQPEAQKQQQQQPSQEENLPPYLFDIPDQLIDGLRSEDPNQVKAAYTHLISGAARAIHQQMYGSMRESLLPQVTQQIRRMNEEESRSRAIHDDFYKAYPFLNNPQIKPMVAAAASQVTQEWKTSEWSPQLRDEIYRRVVSTIQTISSFQPQGQEGGQQPQQNVQAPSPTGAGQRSATQVVLPIPGAPPAILSPGVRPGNPKPNGSVADEIEELLF